MYICTMKSKKINIGKWTIKDAIKADRKASRELELENSIGWVSKHKIHNSKKTYNRKKITYLDM
jgi:hypothetical protein